jgi:Zn-dependent protease
MTFSTAVFLAWVVAFIFGIAIREYLKALVADRLGDKRPRSQGRLTLNPTAHHHGLGLVLAFMASVGYPVITWGKPVEVNTNALRGGRGSITLLSAVGILANLLLGWLIWLAASPYIRNAKSTDLLANFLSNLVLVNFLLFAFDLLPIPPLDGYYFIKGLLPAQWDVKLQSYETYGTLILVIVVLFIPFLFGIFSSRGGNPIFDFIINPIVRAVCGLFGIPLG